MVEERGSGFAFIMLLLCDLGQIPSPLGTSVFSMYCGQEIGKGWSRGVLSTSQMWLFSLEYT